MRDELAACVEQLDQFVGWMEEKYDLSDDTTEELLEAFDDAGYGNPMAEVWRLTAQGRKFRDIGRRILAKPRPGTPIAEITGQQFDAAQLQRAEGTED